MNAREPWLNAPKSPREWQRAALPEVVAAVRAGRRGIVSAIMGSGKSVLISELAWLAHGRIRAAGRGHQVIITAPSIRLVDQLAATVAERVGARNVGKFYTKGKEPNRPIVVACNPSVAALSKAMSGRCALWIADEAHRTEAEGLREAHESLNPVASVGFSATAFRSNDKERLRLWDSVSFRYTLGEALRDGVLVPWDLVHYDGVLDRRDVNAICLDLIQKHGHGPGIASAKSIEDAEEFAEYLVANGVSARAIHSKQSAGRQGSSLASLERGGLRCLVHVSLLAEGVDMPWLRWGCLRRKVGARVRFTQEVGRFLRCAPGKTSATLIDPYDLFEKHGISHPEALGEPDPEKPAEDVEPEEDFPLIELPPRGVELPPAVAVDAVGAWSRRMLSLMEVEGLYERSQFDNQSAGWRREGATEKQIRHLGKLKWSTRHMPKAHRNAVSRIVGCPWRLRAGVASDLISVLGAVADAAEMHRKAHRHWPWPSALDVPELPERVLGALV